MPATLTTLDSFTRANATLAASGNWADLSGLGTAGGLNVISNQCGATASDGRASYWSAAQFGPNAGIAVTLATIGADAMVLLCRIANPTNASTITGYYCYIGPEGSQQLFTVAGATFNPVGSGFTATIAVGSVLQLEAVGSTFTLYDDGVQIAQWSDSTYSAAGYCGVELDASDTRIDDFKAGAVPTVFTKTVTATTTFTAAIPRQARKTTTATTTFTATAVRRAQLVKAAPVTFTAVISNKAVTKTLAATTTFTGTVARQARHTVAATTTFTATIAAQTVKTLTVTATTVFTAAVSTMTYAGATARQFITGRRAGAIQPDDLKNSGNLPQ